MYYSWIPVKVAFHDLLLYLQGRQKKKNFQPMEDVFVVGVISVK